MNTEANIFQTWQSNNGYYSQHIFGAGPMNRNLLHVELNDRLQISNRNCAYHFQAAPTKSVCIDDHQFIPIRIIPQKFDVLCGKEKVCINHEGSRHFRKVIDLYREKYKECKSKYQKMMVTREIYNNLQKSLGSRFLRYNTKTDSWDEISEIVARDKISHALRFACIRQKDRKEDERQQRKKPNDACSGNKKTILQRASTISVMPSSSGEDHPNSMASSSSEGRKPRRASTTVLGTDGRKERNSNPMIWCESDLLPCGIDEIKVWDQFVERQQNLMRSIQQETLFGAASCNAMTTSPIVEKDPSVDGGADTMMKGPLLFMDDCSLQLDEEDFSDLTNGRDVFAETFIHRDECFVQCGEYH